MNQHISRAQIKLVTSLAQKKYRDQYGLFVAEGEKCIGELEGHFELELRIDDRCASEAELKHMSNLQHPQGVIAIFHKPTETTAPTSPGDLVLALDDVQDPGNLGTIIRTADWFGIRDIYCNLCTADCYAPKVVQATMGALSRVRVHYVDLPAWLSTYPGPVYGTLLNGRNMYENGAIIKRTALERAKQPGRCEGVIVMGNEGNGICDAVKSLVTHPLLIPAATTDKVESLNVAIATAVVLAEFRRP